MAGSYAHCCDDEEQFTFDLIENMRDAYEACEMMFWMIAYLSRCNRKRIAAAEAAYYASLRSPAA
jgi:hypothetical protein